MCFNQLFDIFFSVSQKKLQCLPRASPSQSDLTNSTMVFLPNSTPLNVPFCNSLHQMAKPLLSHKSNLILSLCLLMKIKISPLVRPCGICFLYRNERPLKPIRISTALLKRKYRWWAEKLSMTTHANQQEAQFFHTHALQTNHYPIRKCEWNTRSSPRLNYLMEKRRRR